MKNLTLEKNQRAEINDLFMNIGDKAGLSKLYEYTNDSLIVIMIDWLENEDIKSNIYNDQTLNNMFDELINYLYDKYEIDNF